MKKDGNFFVGLFWGSVFSIILWISFFSWIKILLKYIHHHKDSLIQFWW
ncbi:hypothetical protein [Bacillus sp. C30]